MSRTVEQILDLGRWAPSGDNTQPWRFEILADDHVVIHGFDTREHCIYDLNGHPSQIAHGALLETITIAATRYSLKTIVQRRIDMPETHPTFDVHFQPDPTISVSPLIPFIESRSVERRPMSFKPLTDKQKQLLTDSVGPDYSILWFENFRVRLSLARLMYRSAQIRLILKSAFEVHRKVIEWNARYSIDRIPDKAVGLDPVTTRLMQWAMQDWRRMSFINSLPMGTVLPRVELDFLPAMACSAHAVLKAKVTPQTIDDYVNIGRAIQRFWLTGTLCGLSLQPELTPLIFSKYRRLGVPFTDNPDILERAHQVDLDLQHHIGTQEIEQACFMFRLGTQKTVAARSIRQATKDLMI